MAVAQRDLQMVEDYKEIQKECSMNLSMKYVLTSCNVTLSMDQLNLNDNTTPNDRLSNNLLPLLREQLKDLVLCLDRGNLIQDSFSKVNAAIDDFQSIENTLDLIYLAVPLCWAEDDSTLEKSPLEDLSFRRFRLEREHLQLIVRLSSFFCSYHNFWEASTFSENFTPMAENEKAKVIDAFNTTNEQIDGLTKFLENSVFGTINADLRSLSSLVNLTLTKFHQKEDLDDPMIPAIKLTRAFINKFSKRTNNDIILFRRMPSKELVLLQRAASSIPYWVNSLSARFHNNPHNHENLIDAIARTIACFENCFEHLNPFLKSPPPEVDPKLVLVVSQWFKVWHDQFFEALYNVTYCLNCKFPTDEQCAAFRKDPFRV